MNKVILVGRLTRDPDVRYGGQSNTAVARFTLAVDRQVKRDASNNNQETADFISCVAFGSQAEFIEKYARRGTKFVLEGRIQTGRYTNKDGQTVYTTDVVTERLEFAESKNASGNGSGNFGGFDSPAPQEPGNGFMNIPDGIDEELPFN